LESLLILFLFLLLVLIGIPIVFAMIFMGLFFVFFFGGGISALLIPINRLSVGFSFAMLAIFCFILLGILMEEANISNVLVTFLRKLFGKVFKVGRVGMIMVLAAAATGTITGSVPGTTTAVGGVLIPYMRKYKYDINYSATLLSYSGILGTLIPPSIAGLIYATIVNISVLTTWMAVASSGIIFAAILMISNYIISKKRKYDISTDSESELNSVSTVKSFFTALPSLLVPVGVLGAIYGGIATPTEAGIVGSLIVLILGVFYYKKIISIKQVFKALYVSAYKTSIIMFVILGSFALSHSLTTTGVVKVLANSMLTLTDNKYLLLLLTEIILLVLGCFLDSIPIIVLLAPFASSILIPAGIHPFHLANAFIFTSMVGLITPPVGTSLYAASSVSNTDVGDMLKDIYILFIPSIITVFIITFVPAISLFIPRLLGLID
jgi:C4-dicarboxylate transporter, DctM subunit